MATMRRVVRRWGCGHSSRMANIIAVPLNKLSRSARNVRKSGGESIDDLASSILVHGMIVSATNALRVNGLDPGPWSRV